MGRSRQHGYSVEAGVPEHRVHEQQLVDPPATSSSALPEWGSVSTPPMPSISSCPGFRSAIA
jgi:hypothetical protein